MSNSQSRSITGVIVLIAFLFLIFAVLSVLVFKNLSLNKVDTSLNGDSPLAAIEIKGPIMESEKIIKLLFEAEKDDSIEAIILRIDSPGGAVGPTQEIYEEVVRIDQVKPIFASFGTVAASGGYYIGAAARRIYANAGTLTGSIGVIMQFMDMSKLYEWAKVNPETIKAGKFKDIGSPYRKMKDEEKTYMNDMLAGVHRQFINDISKIRKDRVQGELLDHAQGQIFSGEQALKLGLVDEIAGLWAAGRKIHKELGLKGDFDIRFLKEKKKFSWKTIVEDLEQEAKGFVRNLSMKNAMPMFMMDLR